MSVISTSIQPAGGKNLTLKKIVPAISAGTQGVMLSFIYDNQRRALLGTVDFLLAPFPSSYLARLFGR